jgi:hypothetical protein
VSFPPGKIPFQSLDGALFPTRTGPSGRGRRIDPRRAASVARAARI